MRLGIGIVLLLSLTGAVVAQPGEKEYWDGAAAVNGGNVERGIALYEAAAAKGNQKAKNALVQGYSYGHPFPQDFKKAQKLARKYLNLDDIESMWLIVMIDQNGFGIEKDPAEAEKMLRRVVKIGDPKTHQWHIDQAKIRLMGIDREREEKKNGKKPAEPAVAAAPPQPTPVDHSWQKYATGTYYKRTSQPWGDDMPWMRVDGYDPQTGVYEVMLRSPGLGGGYDVVMGQLPSAEIDEWWRATPNLMFCDKCAGSGWVPEFHDKYTTSYTWGSSSGRAADYGLYAEAEKSRELGRAKCTACSGSGGRRK